MDIESLVKLKKIEPQLVESLDFESIGPGLIQYRVISNEEYTSLSKSGDNSDQVKQLVASLYRKGSFAISCFGEALEEDYDWLAHTLKNTVVTPKEVAEYKAQKLSSPSSSLPTPSSSSSRHVAGGELLPSQSRSPGGSSCSSSGGRNPMGSPAYSSASSELHSPPSSQGFHSPRHSSEFSHSSASPGHTGSRGEQAGAQGLKRKSEHQERRREEDEEVSEEMIEFVMANPRVMRGYTKLAHHCGLTNRLPVIQMRVREEMRDHDELVGEVLREWKERSPGEATRRGLIRVLRALHFNDTAMKIEDGSFNKRKRL